MPVEQIGKARGIRSRLIWITGTTIALLFIAYMSLLLSSDDLSRQQRGTVDKAIAVLADTGFQRQVFALKHLTSYRKTDNWWNRYVGHRDAYAATNFPFEVVTLYPEFFSNTADDNERAAVLLHEAYHLFGASEEGALEKVWRNKQRVGWTGDVYGQSRVWINTRDLTKSLVPSLFVCGPNKDQDCTQ